MTEIIEKNWYKVSNEEELNTPSLLVYPLRIKKNIESMIQIAGGVNRLWPHIKTHKMSKIIKKVSATSCDWNRWVLLRYTSSCSNAYWYKNRYSRTKFISWNHDSPSSIQSKLSLYCL